MIGILLAGGDGTRLRSRSGGRNKHLLPVAGEPMIAHGLRKLDEAGIEEVLLVTGRRHRPDFAAFLAGPRPGPAQVRLVVQDRPDGIGAALARCGPELEGNRQDLVLLLGDNLFQAPLAPRLEAWREAGSAARIHLQEVPDCERFGVARLDASGRIRELVEKPPAGAPGLAVCGLYFLPPDAPEVAAAVPPSARGEVEILDVLRFWHRRGRLDWAELPGWWVDAGTPEGLDRAEALLGGFRADSGR
ncbi:MAG: sugar nucleotidyltransferase [Planctomycetota bacterium]|nr:MAG: sugar nucleotidyltransferase [Planctomycetota bacterium]